MSITVTKTAADRVQAFLAKRGKGIGLRLGVKTTGCSGLAYKLEFVDNSIDGDAVFESMGVTIFVDGKSLAYLGGTELDYGKDGFKYAKYRKYDKFR